MNAFSRNVLLALAGLLLIALGFLWKHERDARRDGAMPGLTKQITDDSLARVAASRYTDTVNKALSAATDSFTVYRDRWRHSRDTVRVTVERIVRDTVRDSIKVVRLVAIVDTLVARIDSVVTVADSMRAAGLRLQAAFAGERVTWNEERQSLAVKVRALEKQSRHWGLCAAGGYGIVKAGSAVVAGPSLSVGICYRY